MSQGMNDLLAGISAALSSEDVALMGLQGLIGGEIAAQRIKRGMNQAKFAAFMGVSQSTVSKWECGDCNFTLQTLVHIASVLDISLQSPFISASGVSHMRHIPFPTSWNTLSSDLPQQDDYAEPVEELEEM